MKTSQGNINTTGIKKSRLSSAILLASSLALGLSLSGCLIELNVDGETVAKVNTTKTGVLTNTNGAISVNGTTYNIRNAKVVTDGVETDPSSLKDGMVVSISGTTNSDGTGTADVITYNDELEGMVTAGLAASSTTNTATPNTGTILVLDQAIHVDKKTIFESYDVTDLSINDIDVGNIVEVSGYSSGDGQIWATRIEVKDMQHDIGEEIELKGNVSNLTETSFSIGNLSINLENAVLDNDFLGALKNGQYVEVSSDEGFDVNGVLIANKIELRGSQTGEGSREIKYDNDDESVEVKGAVTLALTTNTTDQTAQLEINGVPVLLDSAITMSDAMRSRLIQGAIVEAKGYINSDGVFIAKKLEIENYESAEKSESSGSDDNDDRDDSRSQGSDDDGADDSDSDRMVT